MARPVVVDANLVAALMIALPYSRRAVELFEAWNHAQTPLSAPSLLLYELATVLRKAILLEGLTESQAQQAFDRLARTRVEIVEPNAELLMSALRWAARLGQVVAYDAQYLALAESRDADFFSADRKLCERAQALGISWVHHVFASG